MGTKDPFTYTDRPNSLFTESQRKYVKWYRDEEEDFDPSQSYQKKLRQRMRARFKNMLIDAGRLDPSFYAVFSPVLNEIWEKEYEELREDSAPDGSIGEVSHLIAGMQNLQAHFFANLGVGVWSEITTEAIRRAMRMWVWQQGYMLGDEFDFELEISTNGDPTGYDLDEIEAAYRANNLENMLDTDRVGEAIAALLTTGRIEKSDL